MEEGVLVPPYRRIADEIRGRITAGELRPGDLVPSARALTRQYGVAVATATKALAVLRDEGLTTPRPGVGTVVATRPVRRPERDLTRERIVRAATAVADAHGMAEVSMRRVAAELGVPTMSLYRHVPGKDDLVLAMIDAVYAKMRVPQRYDGGWRAGLETCARAQWALFRRHPWAAQVMSLTRPQLAPNAMRMTEWVFRALAVTRLTPTERMYVHITLFSFVRGVASAIEAEAEAVQETGLTSEQWMDTQGESFASVLDEHHLSVFRVFDDEGFDYDLAKLFEFGLARLLDGVAAMIEV